MKSEMDSIKEKATTMQMGVQIQICFRFGTTQVQSSTLRERLWKQEKGVNYDESFSSIVKMTTLWVLLGIVAAEDLELKQMDVKTNISTRSFE